MSMKAYNHQGVHSSRILSSIFRERRLQRRSLSISTNTNETFHEPVYYLASKTTTERKGRRVKEVGKMALRISSFIFP